jgi:hypothetical protein
MTISERTAVYARVRQIHDDVAAGSSARNRAELAARIGRSEAERVIAGRDRVRA